MSPRYIPAGYHAVTPFLSVRDAARAIDFYKTAFGHIWVISTHKEDVSEEEMQRRTAALFSAAE